MQLSFCQVPAILSCCLIMLLGGHFATPQSGGNYETFGFRKFEATVLSPYQMIHVNQENAQFVRSHILKQLETHGLTLSSSPDLYVDLFVFLKLHRQVTGGYSASVSGSRGLSIYEVGTLTVQLIEAKNNEVLWESSRSIPLWKKKEKKIRNRVDNIVAKLFKNFNPSTLRN